ncbi:hypothetical protein Fmac_025480 [Flemingia macrophylla]|uniref:Uncharacterized protein n=1 Tax=Flemingia macrophylla TaxID=520843 RepID=A0ABD1LSC0_9FABA
MGDILGSFPESVRVRTKHAEKSCGGMGDLLGSFPESVRVRTKHAEKLKEKVEWWNEISMDDGMMKLTFIGDLFSLEWSLKWCEDDGDEGMFW